MHVSKEEVKEKQEVIASMPEVNGEEEDEYDRAEKFAKTELYKEKCFIYQQAIFQIDLSLTSFVSFAPPILEETKQETLLVHGLDQQYQTKIEENHGIDANYVTPVKSEVQDKSAIKKRVSICLENIGEIHNDNDAQQDELLAVEPSEPRVSLSLVIK